MCEHRYVEKEIDTRDRVIDREEKENNTPFYLSGDDDPGLELRKRVEESMKRIEQRRANG